MREARRMSLRQGGRSHPLVSKVRLGFDQGREETTLKQVLAHRFGAAGREVVDGMSTSRERGKEGDLPVAPGHKARQRIAKEVLDDEHRHRSDHRGHSGLEGREPADNRRHRVFVEALEHHCQGLVVDREPCTHGPELLHSSCTAAPSSSLLRAIELPRGCCTTVSNSSAFARATSAL